MADIELLQTPEQNGRFLSHIIAAGDANTNALGWLPHAVYRDAVEQGRIWVLTQAGAYCGHAFFGGARPMLKIKQLFVEPACRGRGLARRMIDALVRYGEAHDYGSIRARVAEDLEANTAWERLGFEAQGTARGGVTTERQLIVRFRKLTPCGRQAHFFDLCDRRTRELQRVRAHGLPVNRLSCYTLDVNVWLDFVRRRAPFADAARALIQQAAANEVRLRITDELRREAERTRDGRESDPLLDFALSWPMLPAAEPGRLDMMESELRALVFPDRSTTSRRAKQDRSDLRHLAFGILNGATGFVTREKALLRSRDAVFERFGFEVVAPSELVDVTHGSSTPSIVLGEGPGMPRLDRIEKHRDQVEALLDQCFAAPPGQRTHLDPETEGTACLLGDTIVGALHWPRSTRQSPAAQLAIAPRSLGSEDRQQVFDILLGWLLFNSRPERGLTRVLLRVDPKTAEVATTELEQAGFFPTARQNDFVRFIFADPTQVATWADVAAEIERELGAVSTWLGDTEDGPVLRLQSDEGQFHFDRFAFESSFGPTAETLVDRASWFVPIQPNLRDELLPLAAQPALFRRRDAAWRIERVYFRSPSKPLPSPGDVLLFYVSKPTSAVVGYARCTASGIVDVDRAEARFARQAVIDPADAAKRGRVHSIAFDNYVPLNGDLSVRRLRELGAWPGQGILSTVRLPAACRLTDLLTAARA